MPVSGSTARRYAEAMLSFAQDERTVQQFRASLDRLGAAFDRKTVLALTNAAVRLARGEAAVAAGTTDEPVEVRSLLRVLIDRDHTAIVAFAARALAEVVD